jgi:uncharacterized protein (TIGR02145 family)
MTDFALILDENNRPQATLDPADAVLNAVLLSLHVKRGAWFFNPDFGSRLSEIKSIAQPDVAMARRYAIDALRWMIDAKLANSIDVTVTAQRGGRLNFKILIDGIVYEVPLSTVGEPAQPEEPDPGKPDPGKPEIPPTFIGTLARNSGTVVRSTDDGVTWQSVEIEAISIDASCYGDGVFICAGNMGDWSFGIWRSTDGGETWERIEALFGAANYYLDIAYGDGVFIVAQTVMFDGTSDYISRDAIWIWRSIDGGVTWERKHEQAGINGETVITYGNGVFIVATSENIFRSTDSGITWQKLLLIDDPGGPLADIAYGDDVFIILKRNSVRRSTDGGVTWELPQYIGEAYYAIAFGGGIFVIAGYSASGSRCQRSLDGGRSWQYIDMRAQLNGIAYKNGVFVVSGYGRSPKGEYSIQRSLNGAVTWEDVPISPVTINGGGRVFSGGAPGKRVIISFNPNGGSPMNIPSVVVERGATFGDNFPQVTNSAYPFEGWFEGDEEYTQNTVIAKEVLLTARWGVPPSEGIFTDERDGQQYPYKRMPDGKIWMTKNFNYQPPGGGWRYYNDNPANGDIYGKLYTREVASDFCPDGWHTPSHLEWEGLVDACGGSDVAGKKLKSTEGWYDNGNGTDDFGFNARPGGYYYDNAFYGILNYGYWFGGMEYWDPWFRLLRDMSYADDAVYLEYYGMELGCSVRLIRDID